MRYFPTGATRDIEAGKLDYEAFLSPAVLRRYAEYMHKKRLQNDGVIRSGDNWQRGMPSDCYLKSAWRHFMDVWLAHRGYETGVDVDEALCALLFNVMGYLFNRLEADIGPKIFPGLEGITDAN